MRFAGSHRCVFVWRWPEDEMWVCVCLCSSSPTSACMVPTLDCISACTLRTVSPVLVKSIQASTFSSWDGRVKLAALDSCGFMFTLICGREQLHTALTLSGHKVTLVAHHVHTLHFCIHSFISTPGLIPKQDTTPHHSHLAYSFKSDT